MRQAICLFVYGFQNNAISSSHQELFIAVLRFPDADILHNMHDVTVQGKRSECEPPDWCWRDPERANPLTEK